jgi:thermitase
MHIILSALLLIILNPLEAHSAPTRWLLKTKHPKELQALAPILGTSFSNTRLLQADSRLIAFTASQEDLQKSLLSSFADSIAWIEPVSQLRALPISQSLEPKRAAPTPPPAPGLPDDKGMPFLWGMYNWGQKDVEGRIGRKGSDIAVLPLWAQGLTGSHEVIVGVVDTGIDWKHPELAPNLFVNSSEIDGNRVDDDRNGYVDDVIGWNSIKRSGKSQDDQGHGTHCAGTIGAIGNNKNGVAGVVWNVRLMPLKFLNSNGYGSTEDAIEAIAYGRKMGVQILNNSWGGDTYSRGLEEEIERTRDAGILFVAAAGNDGSDNDRTPKYPASYAISNILTVAATNNQDQLTGFSNYGALSVHVAAPGLFITSTTRGQSYDNMSGTSMAAPHVSGAAALLKSVHPQWSASEIRDRLIRSSQPVPSLRRKVQARGRVHVSNALLGVFPDSADPAPSEWRSSALSLESAHPLRANKTVDFPIEVKGARAVRVHFERVAIEDPFDRFEILTPEGDPLEVIAGAQKLDWTSEWAPGSRILVRVKANSDTPSFGFIARAVEWVESSP